jgi:hypothetical protein
LDGLWPISTSGALTAPISRTRTYLARGERRAGVHESAVSRRHSLGRSLGRPLFDAIAYDRAPFTENLRVEMAVCLSNAHPCHRSIRVPPTPFAQPRIAAQWCSIRQMDFLARGLLEVSRGAPTMSAIRQFPVRPAYRGKTISGFVLSTSACVKAGPSVTTTSLCALFRPSS